MNHGQRNYGLSKSKEEKDIDESYMDALPRAVMRPNTYILLDGEWRFCLDLEDSGLQERWHLGHNYEHTASWPGSIEEHIAALNKTAQQSIRTDRVVAWYERDFPSPDKQTLLPLSMLQLTFGACGYETRVWLNGYLLQTIEDEEVHMGEYTSFSYELDSKVLHSINRLTVRVVDTKDVDIPRGKQESYVFKRGGIWYQTYSGPTRSIWLEVVERNRLRSRVGVVSIIEDKMASFTLTTHIHDPGTYTIRLKVFKRKQEAINQTCFAFEIKYKV